MIHIDALVRGKKRPYLRRFAIVAIVPRGSDRADEQLGAGMRMAGVLTTVLGLRNPAVRPPKAKKTLRNRGKGPPFFLLMAEYSDGAAIRKQRIFTA